VDVVVSITPIERGAARQTQVHAIVQCLVAAVDRAVNVHRASPALVNVRRGEIVRVVMEPERAHGLAPVAFHPRNAAASVRRAGTAIGRPRVDRIMSGQRKRVAIVVILPRKKIGVWKTVAFRRVMAIVIVGREILISALREWMAEIGKRTQVAVSMIGKVKTALQMLAIFLLIGTDPSDNLVWIGVGALYIAALLTLWSMIVYLRAAWPYLKDGL
ncbi:MAG: CDP-diacylglycerol--glycerol-3-phosphate 3-phosphatidyltransferase, partial [Pseudomonadota bacterium]